MRPLAIYDDTPIHPSKMYMLSRDLSDWYFSDTGGLMLTRQARDVYFALQGLLREIGTTDGWVGERLGAEDIDHFFESRGWKRPSKGASDDKEEAASNDKEEAASNDKEEAASNDKEEAALNDKDVFEAFLKEEGYD